MDLNAEIVYVFTIMNNTSLQEEVSELISAYETGLGIRICVNAFSGDFLQFVPPANHYHNNPFCQYVKNLDETANRRRCTDFDNAAIPQEIKLRDGGTWKICHGEIMEYVTLLRHGDLIIGKIFFGQFRPGLKPAEGRVPVISKYPSLRSQLDREMWNRLPVLDQTRMNAFEVIFRNFAATLSRLLSRPPLPSGGTASRREQIDNYLGRKLGTRLELRELAAFLGLSASRTGVVIKDIYRTTFSELLKQRRIAYACELLENSSLPVVRVAALCGYDDPGYFHRCFHRETGLTPLHYRRQKTAKPVGKS